MKKIVIQPFYSGISTYHVTEKEARDMAWLEASHYSMAMMGLLGPDWQDVAIRLGLADWVKFYGGK